MTYRTVPHHLDGQVAYLMTNIVKENCLEAYNRSEKAERALKKHNQNVKNVWWNIRKHEPNETKIRIKMENNNNKNWERLVKGNRMRWARKKYENEKTKKKTHTF